MWFKQIQIFNLSAPIAANADSLSAQLEPLVFTPCLASLPASLGWAPPLDIQTQPLVVAVNLYLCFAMQFEEKLLPATVIRQQLDAQVRELEKVQNRKLKLKEKQSLKEEITHTLTTQAFTKKSMVHAYIDTNTQQLVLNTTHAKKTEQFVNFFKRCTEVSLTPVEVKPMQPIMTNWLRGSNIQKAFHIEKSALLQDPNNEKRLIRCQQQNLFHDSIQKLLDDGCAVKQIKLDWQDRIQFVLNDDFSLRSINYNDELLSISKDQGAEGKLQQFMADALIMNDSLRALIDGLQRLFLLEDKVAAAA